MDAANHQRIKMLVAYGDDKIEELMSHNELCALVADTLEQFMLHIMWH